MSRFITGLQMIVNINQSNYVSQIGDIAGLRVIVLSQHQIAFPEDEGITVSPGYFTSIGLQKVNIYLNSSQLVADPGHLARG